MLVPPLWCWCQPPPESRWRWPRSMASPLACPRRQHRLQTPMEIAGLERRGDGTHTHTITLLSSLSISSSPLVLGRPHFFYRAPPLTQDSPSLGTSLILKLLAPCPGSDLAVYRLAQLTQDTRFSPRHLDWSMIPQPPSSRWRCRHTVAERFQLRGSTAAAACAVRRRRATSSIGKVDSSGSACG